MIFWANFESKWVFGTLLSDHNVMFGYKECYVVLITLRNQVIYGLPKFIGISDSLFD